MKTLTVQDLEINKLLDYKSICNPTELGNALLIAQSLHIVLIPAGNTLKFWCPGVRVPMKVRSVIWQHRREVLRLIGQSHILVCPSPELHRQSWSYEVRRDCCNTCARINHYMDGSKNSKCA